MNIDTQSQITTTSVTSKTTSSPSSKKSDANFAEELTSLSKNNEEDTKTEKETAAKDAEKPKKSEKEEKTQDTNTDDNIDGAMDGLNNAVEEINKKLSQKDEKSEETIKGGISLTDKNKNEANNLINNDMNIQDLNEQQFNPQMSMNMNFNNDGQPFAGFLEGQNNQKLAMSEKDLKEESAILSTMSENMAIANKNMALTQNSEEPEPATKTVINSEGIKKVDRSTNVTVETVVSYDSVIMDKSDVEFFTNLVENGTAEATQQTAKNSQVSKTLADLIAKSMNDNKPVRIDFDNNISVIIKVGKDGKISADFLPSSQVAEAYLKENLPILKQRFDDNNIEYDELNQRKQQKQDEKDNRKKGRQDE